MSRWHRWTFALGSLLLVIGYALLFFRINAALRHSNLGSSLYWVNPPYTDFERFILDVSSRWFLLIGAAFLATKAMIPSERWRAAW